MWMSIELHPAFLTIINVNVYWTTTMYIFCPLSMWMSIELLPPTYPNHCQCKYLLNYSLPSWPLIMWMSIELLHVHILSIVNVNVQWTTPSYVSLLFSSMWMSCDLLPSTIPDHCQCECHVNYSILPILNIVNVNVMWTTPLYLYWPLSMWMLCELLHSILPDHCQCECHVNYSILPILIIVNVNDMWITPFYLSWPLSMWMSIDLIPLT